MPRIDTIDVEAKRITSRLIGIVTHDETLAAIAAIIDHPDFDKGLSILVDAKEFEGPLPTPAELEEQISFFKSVRHKLGEHRVAVVVPRDGPFAASRMFEMMSESSDLPLQVGVFREDQEAEAWLAGDAPDAT